MTMLNILSHPPGNTANLGLDVVYLRCTGLESLIINK